MISSKKKILSVSLLAVFVVASTLAVYYWFSGLVQSKGKIASLSCNVPAGTLKDVAEFSQTKDNPNANLFISCGGFF